LVAVAAASALIACGADPDAPEDLPRASHISSSAEPHHYSGRQLAAALPHGSRELHGFKPESQCRDITRSCAEGADPGTASIFATRTDDDAVLIVVHSIWRKGYWRTAIRDFCPRGKVDEAIEQLDAGHFSPGERGEARRATTSLGTWRGFRCTKSVEYVFPSGYVLDPGDPEGAEEYTLLLTNTVHYLQVQSSSGELTQDLAEEYLERLKY
jgi:hypothetical protein